MFAEVLNEESFQQLFPHVLHFFATKALPVFDVTSESLSASSTFLFLSIRLMELPLSLHLGNSLCGACFQGRTIFA